MSQFGIIFWVKLRIARHAIASLRNESKLKVAFVSISAALLWFGAFFLFLDGFLFLQGFGAGERAFSLGDIVMVRLLSIFSLTLFLMLIFSNVLISFSMLYRSREVTYLVQSPMSFRTFFLARFSECMVFSSWASAFIGSPLILAYGIVTDAHFAFYLAALAFYVPFVTVPAAIGSILTLLLARVFPRLRTASMIGAAALAMGFLFVFLRTRLHAVVFSEVNLVPLLLDATAGTQSPFLPSFWTTHGVLAAASGRYGTCLFHFLLLLSNALILTWLAAETAHRMFYPGWSFLAGQDRTRIRPLGRGALGRLDSALSVLQNPIRSLVVKDVKLFWRDPIQWSQFVIFFGLMALYIANLREEPYHYGSDFWRGWIVCLNMGACTLILATLTTRFIFPLISLEGRRFWIVGLAPVSFRQLVTQKFWLSVATTSVFTLGVVVLSCIKLEVEPIPFILSVYTILITNFGLAGLAVGLGSLYPNFKEENPARIVSGLGGTLNFLLSMAYIVLVVGAQTVVLQWRILEQFTEPNTFWWALAVVVVFITALSIAAALIPVRLGLKNLETMEFST